MDSIIHIQIRQDCVPTSWSNQSEAWLLTSFRHLMVRSYLKKQQVWSLNGMQMWDKGKWSKWHLLPVELHSMSSTQLKSSFSFQTTNLIFIFHEVIVQNDPKCVCPRTQILTEGFDTSFSRIFCRFNESFVSLKHWNLIKYTHYIYVKRNSFRNLAIYFSANFSSTENWKSKK